MKRTQRKAFIIIAVIVILATLSGTVFLAVQRENHIKKEQELLAQRIEQAEAYEATIEAYEREIAILEGKKVEYETLGCSMMSFLFIQCSDNLYDVVYKRMTDWDARGYFTVSTEEYPGKDGCITPEQYNELCDHNWIPMVSVTEETLSERYLDEIETLFEGLGADQPTALCFGRRFVSKEEVACAFARGYNIFFYDAQNASNLPQDAEGEGRHFISYFYSSRKNNVGEKVKQVLEKKESTAVAFGRVTELVPTDRVDQDQLLSGLRTSVCDMAKNKNHYYYVDPIAYIDAIVEKDTVVPGELLSIAERTKELKAQIIQLRQEINTIYQQG